MKPFVPAFAAIVLVGGVSYGYTQRASALSAIVGRAAAEKPSGWIFAYADGRAKAPHGCPRTSAPANQCSLSQALSRSGPGSTVALTTGGNSQAYVGNWVVLTPGTTASAPVTIRPAPGVAPAVLGGNDGHGKGCSTLRCNGPILTVGPHVHLDLVSLTFRNADNTRNGLGGAVQNDDAGVVIIRRCNFYRDFTNADGGAIDNADLRGTGTLTVVGSTFRGNFAVNSDGGAIANADLGGRGTLVVSGSTFNSNSAINGDGGAIDNGDTKGNGSLDIISSTFSGNVAGRAGAIDNGDNGTGNLRAVSSTFDGNVAALDDGGAIDNADWGGHGTVTVRRSTFSANKTIGNGGGIDNADSEAASRGMAYISASTFSSNIADVHGGALDNAEIGRGTLVVWASTFSADKANNIYGATGAPGGGSINNSGHGEVVVAADIFDAPCRVTGGRWVDHGYNVASDRSCLRRASGDATQGAGRLSALSSHGGPTQTLLPLGGNRAIDAVPYRTVVQVGSRTLRLCPTTDQRGRVTPAGRRCNSGAVQFS